METASKRLESAGHTLIKVEKFPSFTDATNLAWNFFDIDNSGTGMKFVEASGEPVVKSVADLYTPPPEGRKTRTLDNFMDLTAERSKFQAAWHKIFVDNQLDVLVAPGSQKTAVPHDTFQLPPYTAYWNLLAVRPLFLVP